MSEEFLKMIESNLKKLEREDDQAKAKSQLVGRYIREQIADGFAYYKIVKENKKTVRIELVRNIGDDYSVPVWGLKASIQKAYAIKNVGYRDRINEIFSKKGEKK